MENYRTSICGILAAIATYLIGHPAEFPAWALSAANIVAPLATSLGLVFARDSSLPAAVADKPKVESRPDDT